MANKCMRNCSALLVIREMQIEITMRSHQNGYNKKDKFGKDTDKFEPSYFVGGNVKWCSLCGKLVVPQNVKHTATI